MEQKEPVHETLPDECAQTFLLPDTIRTLFWTGCGVSILSSAQMTAEDLAFAVWDLSEAYAAYMQTSLDKGTQRKTTENELPSLTQCTA